MVVVIFEVKLYCCTNNT